MNYAIHGKIASYPRRSSLVAPFQPELIEEVIMYIPKAFNVQITYENVKARIPKYNEEIPRIEFYKMITNNRVTYEDENCVQLSVMEMILKVYQTLNPIITLISITCYFIIMVKFFMKKYRFKNYKQVIILNGLLYVFAVRDILVGYVAATEYTSAVYKCQYLASAYPIQSLFSILSILFFVTTIKMKSQENGSKGEV